MKLSCPVCENKFDIEEAAKEAIHNEIADLAAKFGPHWTFVLAYIMCFRQSKYGRCRIEKRHLLLKELYCIFDSERFEFNGKKYRITKKILTDGMYTVVKQDVFKLKNHNYLKQVLIGNGAERISAEGLTAEEERKRDDPGHRRRETEDFVSVTDYKKRHNIESLVDQIGDRK
jgi:hypothetical protein